MSIICVEGCLGVGKSTLVERVAQRLPCLPFYEEVEANPFLLDFYRNQRRYAIHTQYTFLLLQERQYRVAREHARNSKSISADLAGQRPLLTGEQDGEEPTILCDFHPLKSLIFSSVVLQPEERMPLTQLYHLLQIPQPDLIVYLRADEETILARLQKRNDVYRAEIDFSYITRVCTAYDTFFRTYSGLHITIDTSHIDYASNPKEISVILQQIPLLFSS